MLMASSASSPPVVSGAVGLVLGPSIAAGIDALAALDASVVGEVVRGAFGALTGKGGLWPPASGQHVAGAEPAKAAAASLCTLLLEAARLATPKEDVQYARAWLRGRARVAYFVSCPVRSYTRMPLPTDTRVAAMFVNIRAHKCLFVRICDAYCAGSLD